MDKVYLQVRFASLIKTSYDMREIDDTEYTLSLMSAVTLFVRDYPAILHEPYSVEGIKNAIMKLRKARIDGKDDIMRRIYDSIDIENGKQNIFHGSCKALYNKLYLLEMAKQDDLIDLIYVSATCKLDKYLSFVQAMKEKGD